MSSRALHYLDDTNLNNFTVYVVFVYTTTLSLSLQKNKTIECSKNSFHNLVCEQHPLVTKLIQIFHIPIY